MRFRSMSHHPGVRRGPFEIPSAADVSAMISESERLEATDDASLQSARSKKRPTWVAVNFAAAAASPPARA